MKYAATVIEVVIYTGSIHEINNLTTFAGIGES